MTDKPAKKLSQKESALVIISKIEEMVNFGALDLPKNYSAPNAVQQAYFAIGKVKAGKDFDYKPAASVCTQASIQRAIINMIVEGLNPLKKQCYFIVYKDKVTGEANLECERSYFGDEALAKRYGGVKDVKAREIYKDDVYVSMIETNGVKKLVKHEQTLESQDGPIVGGYCIVTDKHGVEHLTEMSMKKIRTSWQQSKNLGKVHDSFTDEMVKRTLIRRACKPYTNTTDDSELLNDKEEKQKPISTAPPAKELPKAEMVKTAKQNIEDATVLTDQPEEINSEKPAEHKDWRKA